MPSKYNRKKLMHIFPTRMCNVTAWRHSRLRSHGLMTLKVGGWGGIPRELQRFLSLFVYGSTGRVCGRSLAAGKILFTGRQIWSLYLVLWLCALSRQPVRDRRQNLRSIHNIDHRFLYYARSDFMPFADSQRRPKFIRYSCIQFTPQYIYDCLIRYL